MAVMYASRGYLGMMAWFGPFWSRDNCSLVSGVLDRLMTHLSVHVWLRLEGWSPGAGLESAVLLEGVGAMGVAGTVVGLEAGVEVVIILDGTFWCPPGPDEVASVWMPGKACHDFIMIFLCFSNTSFYSSCIQR